MSLYGLKKFLITLTLSLLPLSLNGVLALDFTSYNIRVFEPNMVKGYEVTDLGELGKIISRMNSEFISVQEIRNKQAFKKFIKKNYKHYEVVLGSCGGTGRQHVGFVYDKRVFRKVSTYEDMRFSDIPRKASVKRSRGSLGCGSLRSVLVGRFQYLATGRYFYAVGVHLKAGGTPSSMERRWVQYNLLVKLVKELTSSKIKDIVIMGDFNTTGYLEENEDYDRFKQMLSRAKLKELSRDAPCSAYWNKDRNEYRYPNKLDHVVANSGFLRKYPSRSQTFSHCKKVRCDIVTETKLGTSYEKVSDHCPVNVSFK
ncbi:hypothetical protein N9N67_11290 [Bacteriovoracaceae bacterium]|nr:hypothetical protein [Bacteriovoracaceae bacterium]